MGYFNRSPDAVEVEVLQSTHGQTFVTWPTSVTSSGAELPALPVGHAHPRSRHWVLANKTAILILPGDPSIHEGGVIRHTFNVVSSAWNRRTKTLTSLVVHPANPDVEFSISTSGVGCSCTQGAAGNAGPILEHYRIITVNASNPEFDWYKVVTP